VLQALGVKDALNVDGGGTAAMYIGGSYKVGPGRLLPNAILLTKP
jgi:exopolysaccharide biosynthesis protein